MHISPCLEPRTIYNPYLKELQVVPCGKCSSCLNARAARTVERLECEAMCHQYSLFVTLTYDNEHLPILTRCGDVLADFSPKRVHWKLGAMRFNISDEFDKLGLDNIQRAKGYTYIDLACSHFHGVPYLCSVDFQRFIKRLRTKINREFKNRNKQYAKENLPKIRYYIGAEYGNTTFRPHCHLILFFTSNWLATYLPDYCRQVWQNGNIDSSFVEHSAAAYVSSYLSSVSNLPFIYQVSPIRPFALFSKHPALGTLVYNSEDFKKAFFTGDFTQIIWKQKKSLFEDVPMWRTVRDRLYPRLSYFNELNNKSASILYGVCRGQFESFYEFYKFVIDEGLKNLTNKQQVLHQYLDLLSASKGDFQMKIQRWYRISQRVCYQADVFGITIEDYVLRIIKFYNDYDLKQLNEFYQFQSDYVEENHKLSDFLNVDPLFLQSFVDCDLGSLDQHEIYYLQSLGIDLDKFFSDDLKVRFEYQSSLLLENTYDYKLWKLRADSIHKNSTKTKIKNDSQLSEKDWYFQLCQNGLNEKFLSNDLNSIK